MDNLKIAFESYNMRGNYLFIDDILIDYSVGIDDLEAKQKLLQIYPNPNSGQFNINFNSKLENAQIEIYDQLGKQVYLNANQNIEKGNSYNINLKNYPGGIYLLKVSSKTLQYEEKIIIE